MKLRWVPFGFALLLLAGCMPFWGFVHDETLDGPYRLVAIDSMDEMGLCLSFPEGPGEGCVGDGLPSDTVFAAGFDKKYVTAARRVTRDPFNEAPANAGAIEYYYVIRTADEAIHGIPRKNVVGPLTEQAFDREKKRLGLPEFSRVFDELR